MNYFKKSSFFALITQFFFGSSFMLFVLGGPNLSQQGDLSFIVTSHKIENQSTCVVDSMDSLSFFKSKNNVDTQFPGTFLGTNAVVVPGD